MAEADAEEPEFDGEDDPDEMRAALGGVASGLAEQLTTITQEMSKIREELYGDNGIGGIAQELEKLKSGSLNGIGGLLENPDGEADDVADMAPGEAEDFSGSGLRSRPKAASRRPMPGMPGMPAMPGPPPLDKERKLEELRRRIERRHLMEEKKKEKEKTGFLEWLVIIFVIFMMAYTASASFRSQVKLFFGEVVYGEVPDEDSHDFGAIVEEDADSYF